jgi:hypothetical protein
MTRYSNIDAHWGEGERGRGKEKSRTLSGKKKLVNKNAINVIKPKSCVLSPQFSQPQGPYQNVFGKKLIDPPLDVSAS